MGKSHAQFQKNTLQDLKKNFFFVTFFNKKDLYKKLVKHSCAT